jgi:hypothetical protein
MTHKYIFGSFEFLGFFSIFFKTVVDLGARMDQFECAILQNLVGTD